MSSLAMKTARHGDEAGSNSRETRPGFRSGGLKIRILFCVAVSPRTDIFLLSKAQHWTFREV
jgi:hypothetical protein